ncbi:MAG: hypothetical protein ACHQ4G_02610 [Opitutales bacterium]
MNSNQNFPRPSSLPRSRRGTILIVAMLFSAIIAFSLATYINLCLNASHLANRTFYSNAAMNLAEMGAEEALWSFNEYATNSASWSAWNTSSGNTAKITLSGITYSGNVTGKVRVYVSDHTTSAASPSILARSTITLPTGAPIEKWVLITLIQRSKFATGLVAKNNITFNGNASVDSWNSDPSGTGTPIFPYSAGVAHAKGSVGAVGVSADVSVGNANVWGTVAVGGPTTSAITVGPNGSIGPYGTGTGVINPASVSDDFTTNFTTPVTPSGGTAISAISSTTTLTAGSYTLSSISMSGNKILTISGAVTLVMTAAAGTSAISTSGNAGIVLSPGASLVIYTAGNLAISGNGIANPGQPKSLQIYGTSTSSVVGTDAISGNGTLSAIVYMPNSNLTISGNGQSYGSFVANSITQSGNAAFHYDESLAHYGVSDPLGIGSWRELTSATDRASYSSLVSF